MVPAGWKRVLWRIALQVWSEPSLNHFCELHNRLISFSGHEGPFWDRLWVAAMRSMKNLRCMRRSRHHSEAMRLVALFAALTMNCAADSRDRHHCDGLHSLRSDVEQCVGLGSRISWQPASYLVAQCPLPIQRTARKRFSAAGLMVNLPSVLVVDSPARRPPGEHCSLQCRERIGTSSDWRKEKERHRTNHVR
jgi:hypothetical protein